jgi:N,N'-diacetyllegionaminate synthase
MALGSSIKKPSPSESINIVPARKSIVANKEIKKGELLNETNLTSKRPCTGISPMRWHEIIGTVASRDYNEDEVI